jgi:hypothetical protein
MYAELIIDSLPGFRGHASLYKLTPPITYDGRSIEHVVVSSVGDDWVCETYIFEADSAGEVKNWGELPGSYKGGVGHECALFGAGYQIKATA